jgi:site-specific recombinase XerD
LQSFDQRIALSSRLLRRPNLVRRYPLKTLGMLVRRQRGVGHPHRFRRTAAIQFLRNGGNLFALQKMLGHETPGVVRRYVELADSDLEEAHKTASPMDNWNL